MPSLDPLRGFLQDAWLAAGTGWGATMREDLPLVRIDQVWLSSEIEPIAVRVVRLAGSDIRLSSLTSGSVSSDLRTLWM